MAKIYLHPAIAEKKLAFAASMVNAEETMSHTSYCVREQAANDDEKWPIACSALFAVTLSASLWTVILSTLARAFS